MHNYNLKSWALPFKITTYFTVWSNKLADIKRHLNIVSIWNIHTTYIWYKQAFYFVSNVCTCPFLPSYTGVACIFFLMPNNYLLCPCTKKDCKHVYSCNPLCLFSLYIVPLFLSIILRSLSLNSWKLIVIYTCKPPTTLHYYAKSTITHLKGFITYPASLSQYNAL